MRKRFGIGNMDKVVGGPCQWASCSVAGQDGLDREKGGGRND